MFDMRASKKFALRDHYKVGVYASCNNVFNHPVYFAANNTANDPLQIASTNNVTAATGAPSISFNPNATTFGKLNPNSAGLSRILRVGAEFTF